MRTKILVFFWLPLMARAAVDTLVDTTEVYDSNIIGYEACNTDVEDEDCRRYNAGLVTYLRAGNIGAAKDFRALFIIPGWNDTIPDSSKLKIYCTGQNDAIDRELYLYPITRQIFEGEELSYNLGDYPDPDSGVTWNHAYLDVGDGDSVNWTTPGGDFTTAVADTILVTDTGQYFSFDNFNRILTYWDTSGNNFGCILVNENDFPGNTSAKTFRASEYGTYHPLVILFYPDEITSSRRRRIIIDLTDD